MAIDKYGRIIRDLPGTQRSPSPQRHRSDSWWNRFDNAICNFGNAFDDIKDTILTVLIYILGGAGIIILIINVINSFIHEGIGMGILSIFLALIILGIGSFVLNIIIFILYAIFWIIRRIFWSATTLTITVALALAIFGYIGFKSLADKNTHNYPTVQSSVPAATSSPNTMPSNMCCFLEATQFNIKVKT